MFIFQAGPLDKIKLVRDKGNSKRLYAFITFTHAVSVPYTLNLMSGIRLFGQTLKLQCRNISGGTPGFTQQPDYNTPGAGRTQAVTPEVFHRSLSAPDFVRSQGHPEDRDGILRVDSGGRRNDQGYYRQSQDYDLRRSETYHGSGRRDSTGPIRHNRYDQLGGTPPYEPDRERGRFERSRNLPPHMQQQAAAMLQQIHNRMRPPSQMQQQMYHQHAQAWQQQHRKY